MANETESKHERFVRLAETRTNKILDMIQLLGNCSNTAVYEYTDEEVNKIFSAIESALKEARGKYTRSVSVKSEKFTLR